MDRGKPEGDPRWRAGSVAAHPSGGWTSPLRDRPTLIAWLLILALALCDIGTMRKALGNVGVPYTGLLYYVRHAYMPIIMLAFVMALATPRLFKSLIPGVRRWLLGLIILMGLLALYGLIRQNTTTLVIMELAMFLVFFTSVLMGTQAQVWALFERYLLVQLVLCAGLTLSAFAMISGDLMAGTVARDLISADSSSGARAALAYKSTFMATSFPLVMLVIHKRRGWFYITVLLSLVVLFIGSILFAKRGTALVFLICGFLALRWNPGHHDVARQKSLFRRAMDYALVLGLAWVLVSNVLGGFAVLSAGVDRLSERFSQIGAQERISHQVGGMERLAEASFIVKDFHPLEVVAGRGLAGVFAVPYHWTLGRMVNESGVMIRGAYGTHIGAAFLFLKGGLALFLLFYLGWMLAIFRRVDAQARSRIKAHKMAVALYLICTITGLGFSLGSGSVLTVSVAGLCIGYCARTSV